MLSPFKAPLCNANPINIGINALPCYYPALPSYYFAQSVAATTKVNGPSVYAYEK